MNEAQGLVTVRSPHSVDETLRRLLELLDAKGLRTFAVVDHSGEAERVGLQMPPTKLVIFGSPAAGTPLMVQAPSLAIDLPLKLLIRAEQAGGTGALVSYNSAEFLRSRHGLPVEMSKALGGAEMMARAVSE